jgi:hypothetical protein
MEKIYAVKLKQQNNIQILNFALQLDQANAIVRQVLSGNPQLKTEDIWVDEFTYQKSIKTLDNTKEEEDNN